MKVLEKSPDQYDKEFQKLFPESAEIYELILKTIGKTGKVLEVGSGTGKLAIQLNKLGLDVTAVDTSKDMIDFALKEVQLNNIDVKFILGDFTSHIIYQQLETEGPFDFIISTFVLSELTPLKQILFLKQIFNLLSPKGQIFIAAETFPKTRFAKYFYKLKIGILNQINIFREGYSTYPILDFKKRLEYWFQGDFLLEKRNIQLYNGTKKDSEPEITPLLSLESQLGRFRWLKVFYCILNGVLTRKSIKPGLYKVGNPNNQSPLLVTSNYYWTASTVSKTLQNFQIDCYVLVADTKGINVWCAAGGGHFTHHSIIDALRLFDVDKFLTHKEIVIPQLAATGVDRKEITKFKWEPKFGPISIKEIHNYLINGRKKYPSQSKIRFDIVNRTFMGTQHTIFLLIMYFLPIFLLTGFLGFLGLDRSFFWFNVSFQGAIIALSQSQFFAWFYPLFNYTRSFFIKGLTFGTISSVGILFLMTGLKTSYNLSTIIFWFLLIMLLGLLVSLDFAGQTPYSNHLEVEADLILFLLPAILIIIFLITMLILFPPITLLF